MSEENNPNINAVGLTTDIVKSMEKWLRNDGATYKKDIIGNNNISNYIVEFVSNISFEIDGIVDGKK